MPTLEVRDLVVRFGGVVAVDQLSLRAPAGEITGLIGPNGAGKTTTFDVCSGLRPPTSGTVWWRGRDVTTAAPAERAQLGLGRTFQQTALFGSMTVRENIALGRELGLAGANPLRHLRARRGDDDEVSAAVAAAAALCDVGALLDEPARTLSTGNRRLVELARALAGEFDLLLLDEPSAGLDGDESARFADIIRAVQTERGCGVLLVEHDIPLVLSLCDHIYVLDFGRLIFEGAPAEVRASETVRTAYLGTTADAV
ncbi:MAG: ABC transporter ATP-binding protein [Actinobacteria bacterium]|nr:ABC transporter ATP-binding protein [Actinomycetota bacterium]